MVPWVMKTATREDHGRDRTRTVERYYHLYRRGELEEDIRRAGGTVESSGYEKDNWWAIASLSLRS
jgi:tRNA (uracil-5-)-methyltransferase TRM9